MQTKQPTSTVAERGFARGPRAGMGAPVEKAKEKKKTLARLISYFKPEILRVIALAAAVLITVFASVAAPSLQSRAIDDITSAAFGRLPGILLIMILLYAVHGLATLLQGYLSARLAQRVIGRLREDLFRKILRLPVSSIDRHSHGDLMSRMTNDAENVSTVISQSLSSLFSGILTLIGTLAVMLFYNVPLTLLTCTTVILTVAATKLLSGFMRRYYRRRQVLLGALNGTVEEMITDCRTVAAYNQEERVITGFTATADQLTHTGIIAEIIGSSMGPVMNCLSNISFVIVAVFGAYFAVKGYITIGVISAFIVYSKQFSRPINELAQLYGQIETAIAGAERIFEILDENEERKEGQTLALRDGTIEFQHVCFSYVPGKEVIRDFTLTVQAGKKIALVGATGSGKTTIVNLLMRFYEIDSGTILIDGQDIRTVSTDSLRDAIGIVLQDTVLFTDTVRNNLKYADRSVSDEMMLQAAGQSNCDRIVSRLPDGYDTVLTSGGASLSAGERQLLTIGRAFLSFPKILILDEATSSVDTRTEQHVQDAMTALMKGRTSLIIAHRLSTIRDADLIVAMDHGQIVEMGNHEELLARKGYYYELCRTQYAGIAT